MIKAITHNPFRILGVYSNSPQKDIIANQGKLSAFLKVGRNISFSIDLSQYLPTLERTTEIVEQAKSDISIPKGRIEAGQFWFIKQTPLDEIAFNSLFSGNDAKAIDVWTKKDDVFSLQNRVIFYLIKDEIGNAIKCAEKLYDNFSEELVKSIAGDTIKISKEDLIKNFVEQLCSNNQIPIRELQDAISTVEWKNILGEQTSLPLINHIENAISESEKGKRGTSQEALLAGTKLMDETKSELMQLKQILGNSDLKYQMVADRLGLQILQCAINYFNDSDEDDAAYKALLLQKYATSIVVGAMAKDRCNENLKTLNEIISNLPPKEVMKEYRAIMNELEVFCRKPDLIIHSMTLLRNTKPHLDKIKTKLGATNADYLKLSTQVVSNALHNLIAEVNAIIAKSNELDSYNRILMLERLKRVLTEAKDATKLMDRFDLENTYKEIYNKNRKTLMDLCRQCGIPTIYPPRTPTPKPTPRPTPKTIPNQPTSSSDDEFPVGCWIAIVVAIIIGTIIYNVNKNETNSNYSDDIAYASDSAVADSCVIDEVQNSNLISEEIYNKYKDNQLKNGSKPYSTYYGKSKTGENWISFKTSGDCDYVVIVKKHSNQKVYNHIYIRGGYSGKVYLPNGVFDVYFYSGKGWNPNKNNGNVIGGFVSEESHQKDGPIDLNYSYCEYTLYPVAYGNLTLDQTNKSETF